MLYSACVSSTLYSARVPVAPTEAVSLVSPQCPHSMHCVCWAQELLQRLHPGISVCLRSSCEKVLALPPSTYYCQSEQQTGSYSLADLPSYGFAVVVVGVLAVVGAPDVVGYAVGGGSDHRRRGWLADNWLLQRCITIPPRSSQRTQHLEIVHRPATNVPEVAGPEVGASHSVHGVAL